MRRTYVECSVKKNWSKSLAKGTVYRRVVFFASAPVFPEKTFNSLTNFFTGATESGVLMEGCNFGKTLLVDIPKCHRRRFHVFS